MSYVVLKAAIVLSNLSFLMNSSSAIRYGKLKAFNMAINFHFNVPKKDGSS